MTADPWVYVLVAIKTSALATLKSIPFSGQVSIQLKYMMEQLERDLIEVYDIFGVGAPENFLRCPDSCGLSFKEV